MTVVWNKPDIEIFVRENYQDTSSITYSYILFLRYEKNILVLFHDFIHRNWQIIDYSSKRLHINNKWWKSRVTSVV